MRLIRSKGVGIYFVTQNPCDIPDKVLGQLGNRVQHALRAFTPRDQKAVKAAAETFRTNPSLDTESVLKELGVGEALVSFLDERGQPAIVQRAFICPPRSQVGPISAQQRQSLLQSSVVAGIYEKVVDRESAYERLHASVPRSAANASDGGSPPAEPAQEGGFFSRLFGGGTASESTPPLGGRGTPRRATAREPESFLTAAAKSAARTMGSTVGREIIRGVLGGLFGNGSNRRRR